MAFADPQSVTIGSTPGTVSLPRTSSAIAYGDFTASDGSVKMTVSHQYGKRVRRTIRVTETALTADPFVPDRNNQSSMSCYLVIDTPVNGFTVTQQKELVLSLGTALAASSAALAVKFVGGES
jgi:hypothetical protein